eukprot:XP_024439027.1 uncharacterized protein LOC112323800 [Populus trichocarpa]
MSFYGDLLVHWSTQDRRKFLSEVKNFYWDDPYIFKYCPDQIFRRCIPDNEGLLYCPRLLIFSRSVEKCQCHFCQEFCRLNRCSGINSHISKIMSIQSLVCSNEIRDVFFEKIF